MADDRFEDEFDDEMDPLNTRIKNYEEYSKKHSKFDLIENWDELSMEIKSMDDVILYFEKICSLLHCFNEKLEEKLTIRTIENKGLKFLLMMGDWQTFTMKEMIFGDQEGITKTPCIPHMINGEHLGKIYDSLCIIREQGIRGNESKIIENLEKEKSETQEKLKSCLHKLEETKNRNYDLLEELEILRIIKKEKKNKMKSYENKIQNYEKNDNELRELIKKSKYMKEIDSQNLSSDELHTEVKKMLSSIDEYIVTIGEYTIQDYKNQIGDEFDPICGLLYKLKQKNRDMNTVITNLKLMIDDNYHEDANEILQCIINSEDQIEIFIKRLKSKIKENGMFYQKKGDEELIIGIEKKILMELEDKKQLIEENNKLISELRNKIRELRDGFTKNKEKLFKEWFEEGASSKIVDMASYLKNKAYRKPIVKKLFGDSAYKPGLKYCGITINQWEFDYLEKKSLSSVLNRNPFELNTKEEMRYSIKCLNALSKIKDVRKAILWLRNYFAKKLGRTQAGRKGRTDMINQEKRFYNTYIFEDDMTLENFLEMNEKDRIIKYMKQYKQLDREINAQYMTRFYSKKEMKKSYDVHRHTKILKSLASLVFKHETIALGCNIRKVENKRNPKLAMKKIIQLVNKKTDTTQSNYTKEKMIMEMKSEIPIITYDKSNRRYNVKYESYCGKVLENLEYLGSDDLIKIGNEFQKELKFKMKEKKLEEEEKGKSEEIISSEEYDYELSDDDYYSDYSGEYDEYYFD